MNLGGRKIEAETADTPALMPASGADAHGQRGGKSGDGCRDGEAAYGGAERGALDECGHWLWKCRYLWKIYSRDGGYYQHGRGL